MKEKLYVLLAVVTTLGWVLSSSLYSAYVFVPDDGGSWLQKCEWLSFFMVVLGLVTLLVWDTLFLDRRDIVNLAAFPIRAGTLFRAKFASFLFFVGLFSLAVNAMSAVSVGVYLSHWIDDGLVTMFRYMFAQALAATAALLFVFFLVMSLEALLLFFLGPRAFRAVSLAVRFVLAVGCVAFLLSMFLNPGFLGGAFEALAGLRDRDPAAALAVPPLWFTGIYEVLIGRGSPFYREAASRGLFSILGLGAFAFAALAASYRRHMSRSLEIRARKRPPLKAEKRPAAFFNGIILRHPVERAVFHFFRVTLRNNPRIKARLAAALAFSSGYLLVLMTAGMRIALAAETASLYFLQIPLVLAIAMLLGIRTGINLPLSAEANWVFRLTEWPARRPYITALKKGVLAFIILPLFVFLFAVHAVLWGPGPAGLHALYGFSCAMIFREVFFWRYARIPFSCLVVPGKAQIHKYWILYFLGFLIVTSVLSEIEQSLFRRPSAFPACYGILAAVFAGLVLYQRFFVYEKLVIVYEEEPEPVVISL